MVTHLRPALALLILFTILTGLVYPLAIRDLPLWLFRGKPMAASSQKAASSSAPA